MVYAPTALNRTVYAAPPVGGLGSVKPQSALCAFVGFYSTTFFCARKMLRIFLIGHKKTSHTAGTLGDSLEIYVLHLNAK
jgi:hypothetical protein